MTYEIHKIYDETRKVYIVILFEKNDGDKRVCDITESDYDFDHALEGLYDHNPIAKSATINTEIRNMWNKELYNEVPE